MFTDLYIKNFRGLQEVTIAPLRRVNLITGKNNTGKTTVLEAVALAQSQKLEASTDFRATASGLSVDEQLNWMLFDQDTSTNVVVSLKGADDRFSELAFGQNVAMKDFPGSKSHYNEGFVFSRNRAGEPTPSAIFSTKPTDPVQDAIDFNRVVRQKRKKEVRDLLVAVEPRLESLESLQTGDKPLLYADIGLKELIPVTNLGQGFYRLLGIFSEIVSSEAKTILIDEIENGLHYSVLPTVWKGIFRAAQELDVQVFATTHSWECVQAAHQAIPPEEFSLLRMDRVDGKVKCTHIEEDSINTAEEQGWEMRG